MILSSVIPQKSIKNELMRYKSIEKDRDSKFICMKYFRDRLEEVKCIIKKIIGNNHVIQYSAAL